MLASRLYSVAPPYRYDVSDSGTSKRPRLTRVALVPNTMSSISDTYISWLHATLCMAGQRPWPESPGIRSELGPSGLVWAITCGVWLSP